MSLIDLFILFLAILAVGGLTLMSRRKTSSKTSFNKINGKKKTSLPGVAQQKESPAPLEPAPPALMEIAEELGLEETPWRNNSEQEKPFDLPLTYGENKIIALVRDPYWIFAYWEVSETSKWEGSRPVLRLCEEGGSYQQIEINDYANNWYINTGRPNTTFWVELGRILPDGTYILIARSNLVTTPRDRVSEIVDEEWLLLAEQEKELYEKIKAVSGPSSPGLISSPVK
ncbi:MAG: Uncharacterized protein XD63_1690 [Thermoanaerobacterales bacterium 50_218]|nr:MAG: Uncharacterized protein XD63_1690 [Thermoanaerobacterales bacterium 50_218]HAA90697.1 hypothetical protein [Peptococcaceae bacterium]